MSESQPFVRRAEIGGRKHLVACLVVREREGTFRSQLISLRSLLDPTEELLLGQVGAGQTEQEAVMRAKELVIGRVRAHNKQARKEGNEPIRTISNLGHVE